MNRVESNWSGVRTATKLRVELDEEPFAIFQKSCCLRHDCLSHCTEGRALVFNYIGHVAHHHKLHNGDIVADQVLSLCLLELLLAHFVEVRYDSEHVVFN